MMKHTDHDTSEHPGLDEPRPGQDLRDARERAGISRESMAERLRLAVAQFDALERDDYAELPPPAFVRGYFRAYARELGRDPDEYIAAYNRSGVSARDPEIRSGGVTDTASGGRGGMVGLLLIALVAAGGIGAWWYQQRTADDSSGSGAADSAGVERAGTVDREPGSAEPQDAASGGSDIKDDGATDGASDEAGPEGGDPDAADETVNDAETASAAVEAADNTDAVSGADAGEAAGDATEQSAVASPDPESQDNGGDDPAGDGTAVAEAEESTAGNGAEQGAAEDATSSENAGAENGTDATAEPGATSPAATDSPTLAATEAAGAGPDELTLEFSARSWLEVYDDRNRELVYTLYFGSEPITLKGWAPFEVFLGNSPAVTVLFNGEEIDKAAFTRSNNTARFVVDASGASAP